MFFGIINIWFYRSRNTLFPYDFGGILHLCYHLCIVVCLIHPTHKLWYQMLGRCLNVPQNCLKVPQGCLKVPRKCLKVPSHFSGTITSSISQLQFFATGICSIQILISVRYTFFSDRLPNMVSQVTPGGV